jgi:hypothetical protein
MGQARGPRQRVPALTRRDADALRWIGEQYVVRVDALGVLLGRLSPVEDRAPGPLSYRSVREVLDRWERSGLARRASMLGALWVVPTKPGMAFGGLTYEPWTPSGHRLRHVHAVALARLAAEAERPELDWHGERRLRRLRGEGRWALPDGAVPVEVPPREPGYPPRSAWYTFEVELHQKSDDAEVRQAIVGGPGFPVAAVSYLCPPERVDGIRRQLARVAEQVDTDRRAKSPRPDPLPDIEARALPEVPGASYDGRW